MIALDGTIVSQVPSDYGTSLSKAHLSTCRFSFLEHQHAKQLNRTVTRPSTASVREVLKRHLRPRVKKLIGANASREDIWIETRAGLPRDRGS